MLPPQRHRAELAEVVTMRSFSYRQIASPLSLGLLVLTVFLLVANQLQYQADERMRETQRTLLGDLRGKLESELHGSINLTAGLVAYVSVHGDIDPETFDAIAERLLEQRSVVRNITLAPDNIVAHVYPLEGNEPALGLDLFAHDVQGDVTRQVMRTGEPVLAGPLNLVQGGRALIHRVPIYTKMGDSERRYWGLMSTPIDYDRLLEITGLKEVAERMPLAIRGADGLGERGLVFFGEPELFDRGDSLVADVQVLDGVWRIAAAPVRDDSARLYWTVNAVQFIGVLVALGFAAFSWHVVRRSRQLAESESLYRDLTQHMQDVVFQTDDQCRITYLSPAWEKLTGFTMEQGLGRNWSDLVVQQERTRARDRCAELLGASGESLCEEEFQITRREAEPLSMLVRARIHYDVEGRMQGMIGTMVDISERKRAEQRIRHLAMHDTLTGLPNRRLLEDRLGQALARSHRRHNGLAFMFLDLDDFKVINDRHGHELGDLVLQEVGRRLQQQLRETDTLARVGGDEFVILAECEHELKEAGTIAEKLIAAIDQPFQIDGRRFQLGVSIGICYLPEHGKSLEALLSRSDRAMYRAKQEGKGHWRVYDPDESS